MGQREGRRDGGTEDGRDGGGFFQTLMAGSYVVWRILFEGKQV